MHACLKKDALHTTLPPVCPAATVASSYVDFSTNLSGPFSAIFVQNNGPYFPLPKYILTSPFQFFSNIFRHLATSPRDRSAAGANIWRLFTTRFLQHGAKEGDSYACSCVRVWDPRKLHVSVYENAQTIFSWFLPLFKGLYDTHTQPASISYRHAKRCMRFVHIRKQYLAYFSYTETVMRMRVCRWWNLFYFFKRS